MKTKILLITLIGLSFNVQAQFLVTHDLIWTSKEIIAPVIRVGNEIRVPSTFYANDPAIGTYDNSGYGINIHKTSGIGFTFDGVHKTIFKPNGYVGIGTTYPKASLHIKNSSKDIDNFIITTNPKGEQADNIFVVSNENGSGVVKMKNRYGRSNIVLNTAGNSYFKGGNVGIGTSDSKAGLHIKNASKNIDNFIITTSPSGEYPDNIFVVSNENGSGVVKMKNRYGRTQIVLNTEGDSYFKGGNVGIGTTNPGSWKLAVNGKIRAKEIKVETGWSDFVFEDNYKLPTLQDVEKHIKSKGHLKDIPSAKEVEKNGIFLGEMDSKLLQKIEELTLYAIAQEKKINKDKKSLKTMNSILIELQQRLEKLEKK